MILSRISLLYWKSDWKRLFKKPLVFNHPTFLLKHFIIGRIFDLFNFSSVTNEIIYNRITRLLFYIPTFADQLTNLWKIISQKYMNATY